MALRKTWSWIRNLQEADVTKHARELIAEPAFRKKILQFAHSHNLAPDAALAEVEAYLMEMSATHSTAVMDWWDRLGTWMLRGFDVLIDEDSASALRELNRNHSLIFLISHKSYLDEWVVPPNLGRLGVKTPYGLAGANLDFFPLGSVARRTGIIHIRRATGDLPLYKLALRAFMASLVRWRANLIWSIEGGRSRTGKLRPPRFGLLRYVVDAVENGGSDEPYLVPVSVIYDQLPTREVELMTSEARGKGKSPEDVQWFLHYLRGLAQRLGRVYVDFGEPLPLRQRLAELDEDASATRIERIAVEVCHRINLVTPVTPNSVVCIALLGADRGLTLDEILETVRPLAHYLDARGVRTAGAANLADRATIRRACQDLVASGVLTSFTAATTVWGIAEDQHLTAAIYRNTAIHVLVNRAIVEITLAGIADGLVPLGAAWRSAADLRDLLKFEFFFEARPQFYAKLTEELQLIDSARDPVVEPSSDEARAYLAATRPLLAHLVLRPFVDAYAVVAHELLDAGSPSIDEREFINRCLRIAQQWSLQRRVASAESVSGEMFSTALRLARHRGLIDPPTAVSADDLRRDRLSFVHEIEQVRAQITAVASRAAVRESPYLPLRPVTPNSGNNS